MHYEKFPDGTVKCIEDEIPFELPEGWEWTRIFSVSFNLPYGTAKKSDSNGKVAVLRMGTLQNGEIDYSDLVYSSDDEDINQYELLENDLLFNRTNSAEWVGKTAIYRGGVKAIYAGYLIRLRTGLNAEYLNAVMNSQYERDYCNMVKTDGVNQSNINAQKLGSFLIPVPSISEQCRIVCKFNNLLSFIETIESDKTDLQTTIQLTKSKILDLAIRGKLVPQNPDDEPASVLLDRIRAEKEELIKQGKIKRDKKESVIFKGDDNSYYEVIASKTTNIDDDLPFELPDGWEWCRLGSIMDICSSKRVLQSEWKKEGVPFYRAREIVKLSETGRVDNDLFISEEHYQNLKKDYGIPKSGDLMVSGVGTIGKVYIVCENDKFYYKDASVLCFQNTYNALYPLYAKLLIDSSFVQKQMSDNSKGTTVDTITISTATAYLCILPPINEQKRIADKVSQLFSLLDSIAENIN